MFRLVRTPAPRPTIVPIDGLGELDALELRWLDDLESELDLEALPSERVLEPV